MRAIRSGVSIGSSTRHISSAPQRSMARVIASDKAHTIACAVADHEGAPGERAIERFLGDRYHMVRELGRGGMGIVYLGRDLTLDMDVAIKLRAMQHTDATLWIKREFRAVSALRHPNLVELYELVAHERS